jgi:hypothetical protein
MGSSSSLLPDAHTRPAGRSRLHVWRIVPGPAQGAPRAPLTLRVGVTGHRAAALAPSATLERQIADVLRHLEGTAGELAAGEPALYAPSRPTLRLISPLASGADQMLAHAALRQQYELHCPLPFSRACYLRDFSTREARAQFRALLSQARRVLELDGSRADPEKRTAAYLEASRVVLRHSDVLVAVGEGPPPRGEGSTDQIVDEAALLEIPLVWIDANFPHSVSVGTAAKSAYSWSDSLDPLRGALEKSYALPDKTQRARLRRFDRELGRRGVWSRLRQRWVRAASMHASPDPQALHAQQPSGAGAAILAPPSELLPRVDKLANHYSWLYRSAYLTNFLLSASAVFLALLGQFSATAWKLPVGVAELLAILAILAITAWGRQRGWHARWLDYRLLTERLRQVDITASIGGDPAAFRTSVEDAEDDPRRDWTAMLLRAIARHTGFPDQRMGREFLETARNTLLDELIRPQLRYHRKRRKQQQRKHHHLHRFGTGLFAITATAVGIHLFELFEYIHLPHWAPSAIAFLAIFLPALGAAVAGIQSTGEYSRTASQSATMVARLERLEHEAARNGQPLSSRTLGKILERVTDLMNEELLGWRLVFRGKPLNLPV